MPIIVSSRSMEESYDSERRLNDALDIVSSKSNPSPPTDPVGGAKTSYPTSAPATAEQNPPKIRSGDAIPCIRCHRTTPWFKTEFFPMARRKRSRMHRNSDTQPSEGPVLGPEDLRMARLARLAQLESKEQSKDSNDGAGPDQETSLGREDIKEMERILVLEWCDERHNSAATLVGRAQRLTKILSNALSGEAKYRRLRYNNPVVQREILACQPTEKLLRAVGWASRVETNERFLVFNHAPDSKEAHLSARLIERLSEVQKKEQLRADQREQRKAEEQERLERARLLLDDDHLKRQEKQRMLMQAEEAKRRAEEKAGIKPEDESNES